MKLAILIATVAAALVAVLVSSHGETVHACGSLDPLNNNPGTSGYVGAGNTITTNANGTRTLVLQAGTRWEQTHTLPAPSNNCPSGADTPVTPLTPDLSGTRLGMTRGYQHPSHRANVNEQAPRARTGTDAPNSDVELTERQSSDLTFSRLVSQLFEGDVDTISVTSSDTSVATVRETSCAYPGSSGTGVIRRCIFVTPMIPPATTPLRQVHGVCMNDGEGRVDQSTPSSPPTFVQTRPPTCETVTPTVPLESRTTTITVTATNTTLNRTSTTTFTVTVFVDPNSE